MKWLENRRHSLSFRIFLASLGVSLAVLILTASFLFVWFRDKMVDGYRELAETVLSNTDASFSESVTDMKNTTAEWFSSADGASLRLDPDADFVDHMSFINKILSTMDASSYMQSFCIINTEREVSLMLGAHTSYPDELAEHLLEQLDKKDVKNDPFIWSVPKMYAEDETIEILSVPISETWYSAENFTGMAVLNVDLAKFRERLFSDQQNDRFRTLILNEDGLVISHSSEEEIGKDYSGEKWFQKVLAGEKRFTVSDGEGSWEFQVLESGVSGYYLIAQSDYVSQILNINYAVYILAVALAIAVALVVLLLFVVSRRIFQPFNTMVRKLKKTDAEEEFRDAADKGEPAQDEIAFLEQVYSGMYSHLEILRQRREADILVKNLLLGNQKELSVMLSSSGIIQEGHPFIMALIYMENEEKKDTFSMQEYDMVRAMVSGAYTTALEAAGHCTCLDVGLRRVLFFVQSGDEKSVMQVAGEAGESVRHISQVRCCAIISAPQEDGRHCVSVFQRLDNSLKTRYLCGIWDAAFLEEAPQEGAVQAARGQNRSAAAMMEEAVDYIRSNYDDSSLSVSLLAEKLGISTAYFGKLFTEFTGTKTLDYILKIRMEKAQEILLADPEKSIAQAAAEVGYNNSTYFTTAFKKYYGLTPSRFREYGGRAAAENESSENVEP